MLDRTAEALGDSICDVGMRDDASGKDGNPAGLDDEPTFSQMFCHAYFARSARVEEDLVDSFLTQPKNDLRACYCYWPISERRPTAAHSREDQSGDTREMIGATRSRVSHFMNKSVIRIIEYNDM